jgi:hypothetical protein
MIPDPVKSGNRVTDLELFCEIKIINVEQQKAQVILNPILFDEKMHAHIIPSNSCALLDF